jgi:hypothetical protein
MGHHIQLILGKETDITALAGRWTAARAYPMQQGFAAIPMNAALVDDINELVAAPKKNDWPQFVYFSDSIMELLQRDSHQKNSPTSRPITLAATAVSLRCFLKMGCYRLAYFPLTATRLPVRSLINIGLMYCRISNPSTVY